MTIAPDAEKSNATGFSGARLPAWYDSPLVDAQRRRSFIK
jgi:hypothetical protein